MRFWRPTDKISNQGGLSLELGPLQGDVFLVD